jgi:hypothetical protein
LYLNIATDLSARHFLALGRDNFGIRANKIHKKISTPLPAYQLFDEMSMSMFHLHMCSLIELKQTGTVVEYTAAFWEHLHRVLDLNSNLTIKSFIHQYVDGLREDIQAVVRLRSPSSITSASVLARIREEEIGKDTTKGANKLGISDGLIPTEIVTEVFPEPAAPCRAGKSVSTIDVSYRSALTHA